MAENEVRLKGDRLDKVLSKVQSEVESIRKQLAARMKSLAEAEAAGTRPKPVKVKVMIYPAEEGGYWAQCTALPGCVTQGKTLTEVRANIREAVVGVLLATAGTFEPEPGGTLEEIEL